MKAGLFLSVFFVSILGCSSEPSTCEQAACDGETEMCILFGSDTFEPDAAACQPITSGCENDRTCDCLDQTLGEGEGNRFCFDAGGCEVNDGVIELVCPGG